MGYEQVTWDGCLEGDSHGAWYSHPRTFQQGFVGGTFSMRPFLATLSEILIPHLIFHSPSPGFIFSLYLTPIQYGLYFPYLSHLLSVSPLGSKLLEGRDFYLILFCHI